MLIDSVNLIILLNDDGIILPSQCNINKKYDKGN